MRIVSVEEAIQIYRQWAKNERGYAETMQKMLQDWHDEGAPITPQIIAHIKNMIANHLNEADRCDREADALEAGQPRSG